MEENLLSSLKSANQTLDDLQDNNIATEDSAGSLLRLSSALKNIDKEVNKLRNIMNVNLKANR